MPELPEVETIVNDLSGKLKNKKIKSFSAKVPKMVIPSIQQVSQELRNCQIKQVRRRGKLLIFDLDIVKTLLIHLKMTGQLVYQPYHGEMTVGGHTIINPCLTMPCKYTYAMFEFTDHSHLYYNDTRKFGYIKLVDPLELKNILCKYGLEPLSQEFSLESFAQIIKSKPNLKIKQVLLMQNLIAGIGNIYADESLFWSKIRPMTQCKKLTAKQIKDLHHQIIRILKLSIKKRGTSVNTYVDPSARKGNFKDYLMVYHRAGQECMKCHKSQIKKVKLNGRGTSYCPVCQK